MNKLDYILVVDDEPATLLIIESALCDICNVVTSQNPFDAISIVKRHTPLLVLIDIEMPRLDGFKLCHELHHLDSGIPVVFITSHTEPEVEKKALLMGAIDFIPKPVNQELCKLRIANHLTSIKQRTQLKAAHDALFSEKSRLNITLESIGDGVISTDKNGFVNFMNRAAARLTEWKIENAIGKHISTVMQLRDATSDRTLRNPLELALEQQRIVGMALNSMMIGKSGGRHRVEDSAAPIFDESGTLQGGVIVFQDVTEALAMATQMTHLTHHDHLTELPNRILLHDRITQALSKANEKAQKVSVLIIDIDNFKYINDTIGHNLGDTVIKHVATQIGAVIDPSMTLSRIGGDEFALLLPEVNTLADINTIAQSVLATSLSSFIIEDEEHSVSLSIGISVYPLDAKSSEDLIRNADTAMYNVKRQGKNNLAFYSEDLLTDLKDRVRLEKLLHQALKEKNLIVHYQPKVSLHDRRITGVEALVRMQDEEGNVISPLSFIPIAEEIGVVAKLGYQVLHEACHQAKQWVDTGMPLKVAVNIAAQQFNDENFTETVRNILIESALPARYLELEITESAFISNFTMAQRTLKSLKELGVTIALDDFGTGYSSLSYLRNFELDVLKIDRSFVKDAIHDVQAQSVVKVIIKLADTLGLSLVCEGIETEAHCELMKSLGCLEAQGYLFSKPLTAEMLTELVRKEVREKVA